MNVSRRLDDLLVWMARLAGRTPRWVRPWAPLAGAFGLPLTLCLFFVVLPVYFARNGVDTESAWFSTTWLLVSAVAVALSIFAAIFSIVLVLSDPPKDLGKRN